MLDTKFSLNKKGDITDQISKYQPTDEERDVLQMIRRHFTLGDVTMQKPRVEFNDLSVIERMTVDEMGFNTYQPNNGQAVEGDLVNSWRSNAIRPIVRNKVVSVAAHATAKLLFPKIFAYNQQSETQKDAAQVMRDLMEWAGEQSGYTRTMFYATLASLISPAAIIYTEYAQSYRTVKRKQENGKWIKELMLDPNYSGFQDTIVPVDQLYIENFFENDIQKQGWLIWRRVQSYTQMEIKYGSRYEKFKHVRPGVQLIYNDANQTFYEVYDTNMRQEDCEEILYYNKSADLFLVSVNGVLLTTPDNPNPRVDKQYPFVTYGYEIIGDGKCFYYKSLAFKMQHDADIINTLYPMMVDGTYLNLMPPMMVTGDEVIGSDVIFPGKVTTLASKDANLKAIQLSENLQAGMNTLFKVEESINQSTEDSGITSTLPKNATAYEISKREQESSTILGLYLQMKGFAVVEFGKLRLGDILQYLTVADVGEITDQPELVYKTFLRHEIRSSGKQQTRRIQFTTSLPTTPQTEEQLKELSYQTLEMQGGHESETELYRVNPVLFRQLAYLVTITPDVLQPMSEDLERAYKLEAYDKLIENPLVDQDAVLRDFLLGAYPQAVSNPDKYIKKDGMMGQELLNDPLAGTAGQNGPLNTQAGGPQLQNMLQGQNMGGPAAKMQETLRKVR